MIIGTGLIAEGFLKSQEYQKKSKDLLVFCSGVSNSKETNASNFRREIELLQDTIQTCNNRLFIYFSTLSIYDISLKNSLYVLHKVNIEKLIKANLKNYLIVRTSNIVGPIGNSKTVFNFFINAINNNRKVNIFKHAMRNLLDVDDLVKLVMKSTSITNKTLELYYPISYSPEEIYIQIAKHFDKETNYNIVDEGHNYIPEPSPQLMKLVTECDINPNQQYIQSLLEKYYPR